VASSRSTAAAVRSSTSPESRPGHGGRRERGKSDRTLTLDRLERTEESRRVPRRRIWRSPLRRPAVISRGGRRPRCSRARIGRGVRRSRRRRLEWTRCGGVRSTVATTVLCVCSGGLSGHGENEGGRPRERQRRGAGGFCECVARAGGTGGSRGGWASPWHASRGARLGLLSSWQEEEDKGELWAGPGGPSP
jgi:hypothetical protein